MNRENPSVVKRALAGAILMASGATSETTFADTGRFSFAEGSQEQALLIQERQEISKPVPGSTQNEWKSYHARLQAGQALDPNPNNASVWNTLLAEALYYANVAYKVEKVIDLYSKLVTYYGKTTEKVEEELKERCRKIADTDSDLAQEIFARWELVKKGLVQKNVPGEVIGNWALEMEGIINDGVQGIKRDLSGEK